MYGVYAVRRKQIYIDEEQEAAIRRLAARRGVSEAQVIREAMRLYLDGLVMSREPNPLLALAGIVDDPDAPATGSEDHDRDLYGVSR